MTATTATTATTAVVAQLLSERSQPLISVYMPTHRAGSEIWQDPIRLKNLERAAEHELEMAGLSRRRITSFLEPFTALRQDRDFWQHQADGLAMFGSLDGFQEFSLHCEVPELCVVGPDFHLKPLLMSLADDRTFFVLALSQHAVRLFRGSQTGLHEVTGLDLPQGLEHGATGSGKAPQGYTSGAGSFIPYSAEPDHKGVIADYCRRVDRIIASAVSPHDPVILSAVDYIATIYRDTSRLRLLREVVSGNPDSSDCSQLFEKAIPIARHQFDTERLEAEHRFNEHLGTGKSIDNPAETIQAAREGRIETLFVPVGLQLWGHFSLQGEVCLNEEKSSLDQDLLNVASIHTWQSGGRVLAMPPEKMPGQRRIAAITRF